MTEPRHRATWRDRPDLDGSPPPGPGDGKGWWTTPPLSKPNRARSWFAFVVIVAAIVGVFMLADWLLT